MNAKAINVRGVKMNNQSGQTLAIIIPSRNSDRFLKETLSSLANQTELPDEIILSDNCSDDGSEVQLREFAKSNSIATFYRTDTFIEVGPSFNFAIAKCKSDWFFCLHSDDILSRKAVENLRKEIARASERVGLISFKAELVDENSRLKRAAFSIGKRKYEHGNRFISRNLGTSTINFGAVAINRNAFNEVGAFAETNSYWLDLRFYHQLVTRYKIMKSPISVLRYRIYSQARTLDGRSKIAQANLRFWKEEYLPKLFLSHPQLDPRRSRIKTSLKMFFKPRFRMLTIFFHKYFPIVRVIRAGKVRLRLVFDKSGFGNFANMCPVRNQRDF
jgi:glycosyltransferase involved in cell wall biosynthesis